MEWPLVPRSKILESPRYDVRYDVSAMGFIMQVVCDDCEPQLVFELRVTDYLAAEQWYIGWKSMHGHPDSYRSAYGDY